MTKNCSRDFIFFILMLARLHCLTIRQRSRHADDAETQGHAVVRVLDGAELFGTLLWWLTESCVNAHISMQRLAWKLFVRL